MISKINLIHIFYFQENTYFIFELDKIIIFYILISVVSNMKKPNDKVMTNNTVAFHKYNLLNINSLSNKSS